MGLSLIPSVCILLCLSACVNAETYNATTDADLVVGIYPISGQYGLLNRLLFYVLWMFVLCFEKWTWPVLGALAYNMTYSATAAVHALVLAIVSARGLYDLDAIGAWAILSIAATITVPIMWSSIRLKDSVYRPVFGYWSTVIGVGCICCIAALLRDYPEEPSCWSNSSRDHQTTTATLLTLPSQLLTPGGFNCSYSFFNATQPLRNPSEVTVIPARRAFGFPYVLATAGIVLTIVFGIFFATLGCCFVGDRRRTKAELNDALAQKIPRDATPKQRRYHRKAHEKARKELATGEYQREGLGCFYLNALVLPVLISFNEFYILARRPLPSSESVYAVGQWGPWVTVGLALIAAAINAWYTPRWERTKKTLDADQEERAEERRKKELPQIHLDPKVTSLSHDIEMGLLKRSVVLNTTASAHPRIAPLESNQATNQIAEYSGSAGILVLRVPEAEVLDNAETTQRNGSDPATNTIRTCFRVPRQRQRLSNARYDPPFVLQPVAVHLDGMPVQQYDVVCSAYDEVGAQHDGIIIRDIHGHDWVVQKGLLWHRELWENE